MVGEPWGRLMVRLAIFGAPFSLDEYDELRSGVRLWLLRGLEGIVAAFV